MFKTIKAFFASRIYVESYNDKLRKLFDDLQLPENKYKPLITTLKTVGFTGEWTDAISTGYFEVTYEKDNKRYFFKFYLRPVKEPGMVEVTEMTNLFLINGNHAWPGYHGDEPTPEDNHWRYELQDFEWVNPIPTAKVMETIYKVMTNRSKGVLNSVEYVASGHFHSDAPASTNGFRSQQ
jgi:hypothetical protein